ncbi:MAG: hypothetical protein IKW10_05845 [Oscillospiraceae bacterium]|nr:hypothetical protein [Oscillospiraceae bacterium]
MKILRLVYCIIMCIVIFSSCYKAEDTKHTRDDQHIELIVNNYPTDDFTMPTREYPLYDLRNFFEQKNNNGSISPHSKVSSLYFEDVNSKYPVEFVRSGHYSFYKVTEGGYYYVFWVKSSKFDGNQIIEYPDQLNWELSVYSTAYFSSVKSKDLFNTLTPGMSTIEDVKAIDSDFDLVLIRSSGVFSYSYLNDNQLLEIKYKTTADSADNWIVEEFTIVPRSSAGSRYSVILSKDLPK